MDESDANLYLLVVSPWDEKGLSEDEYYSSLRELAQLEEKAST